MILPYKLSMRKKEDKNIPNPVNLQKYRKD